METFKAWKELIKAVKGISSAIEGENSGGEVDNINYIDKDNGILVNKNLDSTKLAFDIGGSMFVPTKVGDLFNQEGVDIINSMLSILVDYPDSELIIYVFIKDSPVGNAVFDVIHLLYERRMDEFVMIRYGYTGRVSDKFTIDTPLIRNSQH